MLKDDSPPGPIGRGPGLWTLYKIEVSPVYFYVTSIIYYSWTDWLVHKLPIWNLKFLYNILIFTYQIKYTVI